MRYVTCYDSFLGGLIGVVFHDSKEEAVKSYRKEAKYYFHVVAAIEDENDPPKKESEVKK